MDRQPVTCGYWCTRGGVFTLVHAPDAEQAAHKAARAMRRDRDRISVRRATAADARRWADLLAQQAAGVDGARRDPVPEGVQLELVA